MAVKVKIDKKGLDTLVDQVKAAFIKNAEQNMKPLIVKQSIELGLSPVEGEGKFQKYSESYKAAIRAGRVKGKKAVSPVNLKLSGDLLDSFFVRKIASGVLIGFSNKLSDIHTNQGAGRSKVIRKMLPNSNESFKTTIFTKIIALIQAEVDRIVGKI